MTPTPKSSKTVTPSQTTLFHFTEREERYMRRAMIDSVRFMEKYGQGYTPRPINLDHYIQ